MIRTHNLHFSYKNREGKHRRLFRKSKKRALRVNESKFLSEEEVIAAIWGSGFSGSRSYTLLEVDDLGQSEKTFG
jgi:hypothetical protein